MSALSTAITLADQIKSVLTGIAGSPTANAGNWPAPIDCLAGPVPAATYVLQSPADLMYITSRLTYIDRMQSNISPGSILVIGDSNTDAMCVNGIHPACVNFGIGGDTLRNLMSHLDKPSIHQAGAVIISSIGINDLVREIALYGANAAIGNVNIIWNDRLSHWMTGKWVICGILPVDEAKCAGVTNTTIDTVNANLATLFANRSGICFVNPKSQLAPSGQLAYHIGDGLHLNNAGYAILKPLLTAALTSIGVN